mgnify:CR=1 FL=1
MKPRTSHNIANVFGQMDESKPLATDHGYARANANLVAAAPELLAALQELLTDKYLRDPINKDRMAKARAAIAKALTEP